MELRDYLRVVRRRWLLIMATLLVCVGAAAAFTFSVTPQYASNARLFVSTSQTGATEAYQGGLFSAERVTSYSDLATSRELAELVIDDLDLDISPDALSDKVTSRVVPETVILELTVQDPDPEQAQALTASYGAQMQELVQTLETPQGKQNAPIKATVVDTASLPSSPASPSVLRNLALATFLGLLLGVGLAVLRELLDNTVKSPDDLERITEAPLMGAINFDGNAAKRPLVTSLEPSAPRVEAFRVLRTNMQFVDVDQASKVFVVSSSLPEEGKTTTALNLAITLTQAGVRTVLVEGDLRRPRAATALGVDNEVGVTTVLVGRVTLDEAMQAHEESGLHVLSSGAVPPNPAELLQSQAMGTLLSELRARYDIVIVDAPPLLPVTDAALLASQADGALLVVRHGKTTRDQLEHAIDRLEGVSARVVGVVLNMVPGRGSKYGYGYGYGYGYSSDAIASGPSSSREAPSGGPERDDDEREDPSRAGTGSRYS